MFIYENWNVLRHSIDVRNELFNLYNPINEGYNAAAQIRKGDKHKVSKKGKKGFQKVK